MREMEGKVDNYRICKRCIMDSSSDPNIIIGEDGICNYCHSFDEEKRLTPIYDKEDLENLIQKIKDDGVGKEYDCVLGLSGGVDSSYMAHLAKMYGLRVLAVHVDAGWNSEIAVENIQKICKIAGYDLHTVVVDWETIKEIQRAFFYSGLANQDTPQDHVFVAAVYDMAKKYGIKYILNGRNISTEGILSSAWNNDTDDIRLIKDVCRKFARKKINFKKYPHFGFLDKHLWIPRVYRFERVFLLNYVPYSKKEAMKVLQDEYGWVYYGGKHYESRLTKFLQEYWLPKRYGWDKRRDHLSSLIVGGELSREEALEEIAKPIEKDSIIEEDLSYVIKKLDISSEEFEKIMALPWKTTNDYKNHEQYMKILNQIKKMIGYQAKNSHIKYIKSK